MRTKQSASRTRRLAITAVTLLIAMVSPTAPVSASPATTQSQSYAAPHIEPRSAAPKPGKTVLSPGDSRDYVHVKFAEGTRVRLRDGELVAAAGVDLSPVRALPQTGSVAGVARLFGTDEVSLDRFTRDAAAHSGRQQADLNLWYRLRLKHAAAPEAVIDALNALKVVEIAYAEPLPVAPPLAPDFTARQGYRSAASSSGIDADYAGTVPGGTGANVRVLDIEYSWNTAHEDLSKLRVAGAIVPNGTPRDPFNNHNHGTAVIGELAGDDNGGGVLGLVPDAQIRVTNAYNAERGLDIPTAITTAAQALRPADVMLLEQQTTGPAGCSGYVPVEWIPAVYDAIVAATSSGIIVVEAAGNGSMNLDSACFGSTFPRGRADSGAIIVGAGGAPGCSTARAKLSFSSYGSRVDLQGWGECVISTGYGDLYGAAASNHYTARFSGTSSASPIVTAAAAALSSVAKQRGLILTPRDVRARLKATGTAQVSPSTGNIGPLPNLRTAIEGLPGGGGNDFSLTLSPASGKVDPGGAVSATVETSVSSGTPETISLSTGSLPAGATVAFDPPTVTAGKSAAMRMSTAESTPPGTYAVTVTGTGASVTRTTTYTLTVQSGAVGCEGYERTATGTLTTGASAYQPDGSYFYVQVSGAHEACLRGPDGTDFDLYLQKWNGSGWVTVASGTSPQSAETLTYNGTAGYYRYRIHSYSGSGTYVLGYNTP